MESSSVHIIASPSNGGKSITLSNLLYRIAKSNSNEFKEGDAALFITCEDDTVKTTRKFMSIFGNYDYSGIREIYRISHEFISKIKKEKDEVDKENKEIINNLFNDMLYDSITKTTSGTLKIIFKYAPEQSLSASEISQQIKKFELMGINIKYLIIDYLDVLKPSLTYSSISDEYFNLGVITQELRTLSRLHGIPVITATQTSKIGDNVGQTLTNSMIGESYKKVKFSDFIYMQRMRDDLDIFSPDVSKFVFRDGTEYSSESPLITNIKDNLITDLKPLEMRVSKSKEKGKGYYRYMIFSSKNLRLYNTVEEYLKDLPELKTNDRVIFQKIQKVQHLTVLNSAAVDEIKNNDIIDQSSQDEIADAWSPDIF